MRWWHDINIWVKRSGAALLTAALVGGGYLWLEQRSPEHRLSEACSGMLPVSDVLDMTGDDFELTSGTFDVSSEVTEPAGLATNCKIGSLWIDIETTAGAHSPYGTYTFQRRDDVLPVPLGSGWSGFIVAEDEDGGLDASVLLDCPNWPARKGSGILVTTQARYSTDRVGLARVATATAQRTAERTGCDATPGTRIDRVDPAPPPPDTSVAAEFPKGTCTGLTSHKAFRETAAATAPVEYCVLEGGLALQAEYGPFAGGRDGTYGGQSRPAGNARNMAWASARCKGALGTGMYWAETTGNADREPAKKLLDAAELKDLRRFARDSAARHGCSAPTVL
ncbi:hypothetical protein OHS70_26690 [Streptomyces sp. NBC_00390]|uniref:hypothetical protein n=1 Tax=Streptomyces sp. NBC_00390 TaxID=2975736 RepID=UPI002E2105CF